ncbi:sensor histidine kinase [Azospirillum soli]|uniref:sensor histidine kinase n=1 Tax=Azospirillum soli TaxID=1304799 RepID=UPI001AE8BC62|nr:histidine kinase dimerization/phosphoacceptor domain -containing protein [Azospirillum soli]MBP2314651.1 two-component sensor histidine kinase [Azospirillum soli]
MARRRTIVGYACLACLGFVAAVFVLFASASYDRAVKRAEQQAHDAAFFFADHGSRLFEAADLATTEAIAAMESEEWDKVATSHRAGQALQRLSERFPYIDALVLVDDQGRLRLASNSFPAPDVDVADRPYFTTHRDGPRGLFISRSLISRTTARPGFVLSRAIRGERGEFRGIAASYISVDYMAEFYRSITLPFNPTITLFRDDLNPLVTHKSEGVSGEPFSQTFKGGTVLRKALAEEARADGTRPGPTTVQGVEDGRTLIISYARVDSVPLYISAAIDRDEVRAVWLDETRVPGISAAVALAALGALTVLVFRQARDDERAKRMLEREVGARTADLRSANAQLEVLMQEVHHRVKNNLQVISSMLRLQSVQVSDDAVRRAFEDSVNRVHAMSLVHEMLSGGGDRTRLEFHEYLQDLTDRLRDSYGGNDRVTVSIECEDFSLDMNQGIQLGLIVNEIFSNALKHGFPQGRAGSLRIALARRGTRGRLTIEDDGAGLPPDFDWRSASSLGLQIVQSLVTKLGGEASLVSDGLTRFTLTFPLRTAAGSGSAEGAVKTAVVTG